MLFRSVEGSVSHMFDHQAVFQFKGDDDEIILETLMMEDVDVTDVELEDGVITVFAPHTEFFKTKTALNGAFPDLTIDVEEITFVPQTHTPVAGEDADDEKQLQFSYNYFSSQQKTDLGDVVGDMSLGEKTYAIHVPSELH